MILAKRRSSLRMMWPAWDGQLAPSGCHAAGSVSVLASTGLSPASSLPSSLDKRCVTSSTFECKTLISARSSPISSLCALRDSAISLLSSARDSAISLLSSVRESAISLLSSARKSAKSVFRFLKSFLNSSRKPLILVSILLSRRHTAPNITTIAITTSNDNVVSSSMNIHLARLSNNHTISQRKRKRFNII